MSAHLRVGKHPRYRVFCEAQEGRTRATRSAATPTARKSHPAASLDPNDRAKPTVDRDTDGAEGEGRGRQEIVP
jgi:hypothetical protein